MEKTFAANLARTDVYAAMFAWIDATHDRRGASGGDECFWSVTCPETQQVLIHDMGNCGLSHRSPKNKVEAQRIVREMTEEDAVLQIRRIASALTYHATGCPESFRRAYNIRTAGSVVVLRRNLDLTRDGSRGELCLSTEAVLAAGTAIERAIATAPIGQHVGTRGGHRHAVLAALSSKAA
jgi:hypothetical protein